MTAPNANTWDLPTPRRPGNNDFNGCAKVDDQAYPPDPETMASAAEYNTLCLLHVGYGKVVPNARISIESSGPSVQAFASVASGVLIGTFTVTHNGTGDVSITWPANTFPPTAGQPTATINANVTGLISAISISNGVRVRTATVVAGSIAAADLNFTVEVY